MSLYKFITLPFLVTTFECSSTWLAKLFFTLQTVRYYITWCDSKDMMCWGQKKSLSMKIPANFIIRLPSDPTTDRHPFHELYSISCCPQKCPLVFSHVSSFWCLYARKIRAYNQDLENCNRTFKASFVNWDYYFCIPLHRYPQKLHWRVHSDAKKYSPSEERYLKKEVIDEVLIMVILFRKTSF